jgi:gliding motility-associated lipoprotein GldH
MLHLRLKYLLLTGCVVFLASCHFNGMFDQSYDIQGYQWHKDHPYIFDVPVTDTIHGYDILLFMRNNNEFPYSNCYFFINTISPKGVTRRDTVQYDFADEKGKWLGKGFGGVWSNELTYKNNIRFPYKGTYRIEVFQAMRDEPLKGLMDISLRIVRKN